MSSSPNYLILDLDGESIYIEVSDEQEQESGYNLNSYDGANEQTEPSRLSGEQLKKVVKTASKLVDQFKEFRADEMEISFSIKVDKKTDFLIAKTDIEGQFGVKLTWKDRNKKS